MNKHGQAERGRYTLWTKGVDQEGGAQEAETPRGFRLLIRLTEARTGRAGKSSDWDLNQNSGDF